MSLSFLNFQKILWLILICLSAVAGIHRGQGKTVADENGVFLKCFEIPQKFLFNNGNASDKDFKTSDADSYAANDKTQSIFLLGGGNDKSDSNSALGGEDFLENWDLSGKLNWRVAYFSKIETFQIIEDAIYSLKLIREPESATAKKFSLREISGITGLTTWQNEIELKISAETEIQDLKIRKLGRHLLVIEIKSGSVFLLSGENGSLKNSRVLNRPLKIFSDRSVNQVFFADSQNNLFKITVSGDSNFEITQLLLSGPLEVEIGDLKFASEENAVYITDAVGAISKLSLEASKTDWKYQTGAAFAAFAFYKDGLLAVSLDNFVYYLDKKNGRKIWKKRLPGRSLEPPVLIGKSVILPIFGDNKAIILDVSKGRQVGQISLSDEEYFLQTSFIRQKLLFLNTSGGIKVYGRDGKCPQK